MAAKESAPRIKEIPELPKLTVPKDTSERATAFSLWLREVKVKLDPVTQSAAIFTEQLYADLNEAITEYHRKDETARIGLRLKAESTDHEYLSKLVLPRLLEAVPKFVKDELMAAQEDISTRRVFWKLATVFLPGGSGEKSSLLHRIATPGKAGCVTEAIALLVKWEGAVTRAKQLNLVLPDPSQQVAGVPDLITKVREESSLGNAAWGVSKVQEEFKLIQVPDHVVLLKFVEYIKACSTPLCKVARALPRR